MNRCRLTAPVPKADDEGDDDDEGGEGEVEVEGEGAPPDGDDAPQIRRRKMTGKQDHHLPQRRAADSLFQAVDSQFAITQAVGEDAGRAGDGYRPGRRQPATATGFTVVRV